MLAIVRGLKSGSTGQKMHTIISLDRNIRPENAPWKALAMLFHEQVQQYAEITSEMSARLSLARPVRLSASRSPMMPFCLILICSAELYMSRPVTTTFSPGGSRDFNIIAPGR
jgi:hypothetical protein